MNESLLKEYNLISIYVHTNLGDKNKVKDITVSFKAQTLNWRTWENSHGGYMNEKKIHFDPTQLLVNWSS